MAKPIKETPILKGTDAVNFASNMEKSKSVRVTQQEADRIKSNYTKLSAIAKF